MQVFDYGNLSTPVRTYNNTYVTDPRFQYPANHIYSKLLTSTVTSGSTTINLVSNGYDGVFNIAWGGTGGAPTGFHGLIRVRLSVSLADKGLD